MNTTQPPLSCADDDPGLLRVEDARARMLATVVPVRGYEQVGLLEAWRRVLHEPVVAGFDVPPHTNSAVDGFALRSDELPASGQTREFAVAGLARAGRPFAGRLESGQAVAVMTGAPLPEGTDTVLMQEQVEVLQDRIRVAAGARAGDNVRRAGEDLSRGNVALAAGRFLTPPDIGLIASLGLAEVRVKRRVRVALLSTGDEVHAIGHPLTHGGIYDSNRYVLHTALDGLNVKVMDQGIVPDDPELLREALVRAAAAADVVISTGGVSVGRADFVRDVLGAVGEIDFWKVAMKPGRPIAFGRIGASTFLGLPGNPVAALVCYFQFVHPLLERKMGIAEPPVVPSFLAKTLDPLRKKPGRTEYQRGILVAEEDGSWQVKKAGGQGSGILSSMSRANVLIVLPHESGPAQPGDPVSVIPFGFYL